MAVLSGHYMLMKIMLPGEGNRAQSYIFFLKAGNKKYIFWDSSVLVPFLEHLMMLRCEGGG